MNIAFDVDDTIYKVRPKKIRQGVCELSCTASNHECGLYTYDQVPDYDLIQVMRWFKANGDKIYVWSAGGPDYAQTIVLKLGLDEIVDRVIDKNVTASAHYDIDLTFDDQKVTGLGVRTNVLVKRT